MKKILYIEDNVDTSEAVKLILTNAGYEVETAPSGKDGLKKIETKFDLILLDIMLPDMSGWDIFATLSNKGVVAKFAFFYFRLPDFRRNSSLLFSATIHH